MCRSPFPLERDRPGAPRCANAGDLISTAQYKPALSRPVRGPTNLSTSRGKVGGGASITCRPIRPPPCALDGVYFGKQVGSSLDVAELQRIEVLRGPRALCSGRNATAGAINL